MTGLTTRQMTSANGIRIGSNATTNVFQGGGDKKAGLPYQIGRDNWFYAAMAESGSRNTLYDVGSPVVFGLRHTRNPNVSISRPIGSTLSPVPYWSLRLGA